MKRLPTCLVIVLATLSLVVACAPSADLRDGDVLLAGAATSPSSETPAPAGEEWWIRPAVPGEAPTHSYSPAQVERGRQLVAFGMCSDCHTPVRFDPAIGGPVPDESRFLSGHPEGAPRPGGTLGPQDNAIIGPTFTSFLLPFGTVYSMNLTPDLDTGTGSWTEEMFVGIFRKGKHMGGEGRPVLPPMPWPFVATLPDEDLVAIFAYLRSLPPVRNYVPSPEVPEEVMWAIDAGNQKRLAAAAAER